MLKVNNPINSPGLLLPLLAKEFCLKSRSECLYFRGQLTNQTVKAPSIPEIVRKIESEQHKYSKLLSSLDPDVQSQGLELQEADMVMVLLRSLPEKCRSYCLFMVTAILLKI